MHGNQPNTAKTGQRVSSHFVFINIFHIHKKQNNRLYSGGIR